MLDALGIAADREVQRARDCPIAFAAFALQGEDGSPLLFADGQRAWIEQWLDPGTPYSVTQSAIGSGKSAVVRAFCLWLLGRDCRTRIALVGITESIPIRSVVAIRKEIESNKRLRQVFPGLRPGKSTWTDQTIVVDRPASVVHPSVTALGENTPTISSRFDWIFIDDIQSLDSAIAVTQRQKTFDNVTTTLLGRLSQTGRAVVVGVPLFSGPDGCLISRLSANPGWAVQRWPGHDAEGRPNMPELWTRQSLAKRRALLGEIAAKSQIDLQPDAWGAGMFTPADIGGCYRTIGYPMPDWPRPCYVGVDPAGGKGRDSTVFVVLTQADGGALRLLAIESSKSWGPQEIIDRLNDYYRRRYPQCLIGFEKNGGYETIADLSQVPLIKVQTTGASKANAMQNLAMVVQGEYLHLPAGCESDPDVAALVSGILSYDPNRHTSDHVMALNLAIQVAREHGDYMPGEDPFDWDLIDRLKAGSYEPDPYADIAAMLARY